MRFIRNTIKIRDVYFFLLAGCLLIFVSIFSIWNNNVKSGNFSKDFNMPSLTSNYMYAWKPSPINLGNGSDNIVIGKAYTGFTYFNSGILDKNPYINNQGSIISFNGNSFVNSRQNKINPYNYYFETVSKNIILKENIVINSLIDGQPIIDLFPNEKIGVDLIGIDSQGNAIVSVFNMLGVVTNKKVIADTFGSITIKPINNNKKYELSKSEYDNLYELNREYNKLISSSQNNFMPQYIYRYAKNNVGDLTKKYSVIVKALNNINELNSIKEFNYFNSIYVVVDSPVSAELNEYGNVCSIVSNEKMNNITSDTKCVYVEGNINIDNKSKLNSNNILILNQ